MKSIKKESIRLLINLNFFDAENMIPVNEENTNSSATKNMLTSIILVSFCSNKDEMISAARPVTERKNRKNNEGFVRCSLKNRSVAMKIKRSEKKIMEIMLPALSSNPLSIRF